jgi:hypothetical protein
MMSLHVPLNYGWISRLYNFLRKLKLLNKLSGKLGLLRQPTEPKAGNVNVFENLFATKDTHVVTMSLKHSEILILYTIWVGKRLL